MTLIEQCFDAYLDILELADSGSALELGDAQERLESIERYIFDNVVGMAEARALIMARRVERH